MPEKERHCQPDYAGTGLGSRPQSEPEGTREWTLADAELNVHSRFGRIDPCDVDVEHDAFRHGS